MDRETQSAEFYKQRVELAAIAIFAGMQANPNWLGSSTDQSAAVVAARKLIDEVDAQCAAASSVVYPPSGEPA